VFQIKLPVKKKRKRKSTNGQKYLQKNTNYIAQKFIEQLLREGKRKGKGV
jgi:hypothetical protein